MHRKCIELTIIRNQKSSRLNHPRQGNYELLNPDEHSDGSTNTPFLRQFAVRWTKTAAGWDTCLRWASLRWDIRASHRVTCTRTTCKVAPPSTRRLICKQCSDASGRKLIQFHGGNPSVFLARHFPSAPLPQRKLGRHSSVSDCLCKLYQKRLRRAPLGTVRLAGYIGISS